MYFISGNWREGYSVYLPEMDVFIPKFPSENHHFYAGVGFFGGLWVLLWIVFLLFFKAEYRISTIDPCVNFEELKQNGQWILIQGFSSPWGLQSSILSGRKETYSVMAEQWGSEWQHLAMKPYNSPGAQMLMNYNRPQKNAVSGNVGPECHRTHLPGYLTLGKGWRVNWTTRADSQIHSLC